MKQKYLLITIAVILFTQINCIAQTYNGPESVEYDYANQQWYVGNKNNGTVIIWKDGVLSNFASGMTQGPYGIELFNGVLYCCHSGNKIRGFDVSTGQVVFNVTTGGQFLNGITHDDSSLYVTDFSGKKIIKVDVVNQTSNIIATGLAKTPNGIFYDSTYNRCVFVTWVRVPPYNKLIWQPMLFYLKTTTLGNIDGLARDGNGNWYTASWSNNAITKFDSLFTGTGTIVSTGLSSPADIFYNVLGDTLGIPNSGNANNVVFVAFGATTLNGENKTVPNYFFDSSRRVIVVLTILPLTDNTTISVYDAGGKEVAQQKINAGTTTFEINVATLSPGTYYLKSNIKTLNCDKGILVY
ncbi:MAG: T9SS type A sorting domain-containing protein [Bacteroidetes bacterium]|nr:T9SS type A sorting domain-containing protein [Bacteroidota bacterium]